MIDARPVVPARDERDLETLRQISGLLDRENQRLITKNLELTAELARLRGLPAVEQLTFGVEPQLQQTRTAILERRLPTADPPRPSPSGHGPRPRRALPVVEIRHELAETQRAAQRASGR